MAVYITAKATSAKLAKLRSKMPGWSLFAENPHGSVYWNDLTGEIMWDSEHRAESNVSLLKEHIPLLRKR